MCPLRRATRSLVLPCSLILVSLAGTPGTVPAASPRTGSGADPSDASSGEQQIRSGLAHYHAERYSEAVKSWRGLAEAPDADPVLLYRYAYSLAESGAAESAVSRQRKRARKGLAAAVKKGAGPVECYYLSVLVNEKDEKQARALSLDCFKRLEKEKENSPEPDQVYFLARLIRTENGYQEREESLLRRAVERYRALPPEEQGFLGSAQDDLGELLLRSKRQNEALEVYDKALLDLPSSSRLLAGRAAVLEDLGKYAEAEKDRQAYLQGSPADGEAWTALGFNLWRQDKNQDALKAFQTGKEKGDTRALNDNGTGLALHDLGKTEEAAAAFRRALTSEADWAIPHYNLAGALLDLGDAAAAEQETLAAIRLDPKDWFFYDRLGTIRKKTGNKDGALQAYRDAAAADASPDRAHAAIGNLLVEQGKSAEGLPYLEKAVALNPKDGFMKKDLGQALENLERYPEAEAAYRESITLAPDSPVPHGYLGSLLESTGKKDQALQEYEAAEKIQSDYLFAVERTFLILKESKGAEAALEYLEPRLDHFKTNASLHRRAAVARDELRQPEAAEKLLRRAIEVDPNYDLAYDSLALVLDEGDEEKKKEALEVLREANEKLPTSANLEFRLGTFLDNRGLPGEAEPHLRKSLELAPDFATAWNSLGAVLDHLGKGTEAGACFQKAIALRPNFTLAVMNLARLDRKSGRHEEAIAGFRKVLEAEPNHLDALMLMADELRQAGKLDEAEAAANQLLEKSPANPSALNILADAALDRKDTEGALKAYARAQEAATDNAHPFRKAAEILDQRGDYVAELDLLKRYQERFPKAAYPLRQRGIVLNRTKRYDQALEAFQQAAALDPKDHVTWVGLGDVYFNTGKFEEANEAYAQGNSLSKDMPAVIAAQALTLVKLGRNEEAIAAYRSLLPLREKADDRINLARLLSAAGKTGEAESILMEGLEVASKPAEANKTPPSETLALRLALAELYEASGRPAKAEVVLRQAVQDSPDELAPRRSLSRVLRAQGKQEAAARQLEAVLEREPDDSEAIAALKSFPREIADAAAFLKKIRPQALDFDPVDSVASLARFKPEDPSLAAILKGESLVVIEDHLQIDVRPGGLLTQTHHKILRATDKSTADALGEYRIWYAPAREQLEVHLARTHLPDGRVVDAAPEAFHTVAPSDTATDNLYSDDMIQAISLPQVQANSEIEILYTKKMKSSFTEQNWWVTWGFQSSSPALHSRLALRVPSSLSFAQDARGPKPQAEVRQDGDHQILTWTMQNLAPLRDEPGAPPEAARRSEISVTSYASWNDVAAWLHGLIKNQDDLDPEARSAVAARLQGAANPTEKARRIYNMLQESIRYVGVELGVSSFQPHPASQTYRNQYGDCKDRGVLLMSMLKEAGVRTLPALIRTRDQGPVAPGYPSPGQFNHFIVYAPDLPGVGGSPGLWLDATAEHTELGSVPAADQGVEAMIIQDGKAEFRKVPVSSAAENLRTLKRQVEIEVDGTARITDDAIAHGYFAERMRGILSTYDENEQKDVVYRSVSEEFPGASKIDFAFTGMALSGEPPRDLEHYQVERFVKPIGKTWTLSLGILDAIERTITTSPAAERTSDFEADVPLTLEEITEIKLPPGRSFSEWPDPVRLDSRHASYRLEFARKGQSLKIRAVFVLKDNRVPLADYPEFAALVQRAIDAGRVTVLAR